MDYCRENRLSDYYGYEPELGYILEFASDSHKERPAFEFLYRYEGECTGGSHCSHCAGWLIKNVPDMYFNTSHRVDVSNGDAREYYSDDCVYHEAEADEILSNLVKDGFYVD